MKVNFFFANPEKNGQFFEVDTYVDFTDVDSIDVLNQRVLLGENFYEVIGTALDSSTGEILCFLSTIPAGFAITNPEKVATLLAETPAFPRKRASKSPVE